MFGDVLALVWDIAYDLLNVTINFGDISINLWLFVLGMCGLYIVARLIRRIFE